MSAKFRTNLARRDPDKVERLRAVLDPLFDQSLVELQSLNTEAIPTEVIQKQDPRAGEKFIDAHRRRLTANAAKKRAIAEHLNLIERILDLTGRDISKEMEAEETQDDKDREAILRMIAQTKQNDPVTAQQIEDETGGAFDFVAEANRK